MRYVASEIKEDRVKPKESLFKYKHPPTTTEVYFLLYYQMQFG